MRSSQHSAVFRVSLGTEGESSAGTAIHVRVPRTFATPAVGWE